MLCFKHSVVREQKICKTNHILKYMKDFVLVANQHKIFHLLEWLVML